jgi:hypothetical protein
MKIFANLPKYSLLTYAYIFLTFVCVVVVLNHNYQVHKAKEQAIAKQQEIVKQQIAKAKTVDPKQFKCLTDNIYYEAGNQGTLGQAAVGRVVLNRVKHGFGLLRGAISSTGIAVAGPSGAGVQPRPPGGPG